MASNFFDFSENDLRRALFFAIIHLSMSRHYPDLPVVEFLPRICEALKSSPTRFLILTAETGAGKSTVVPLALADCFPEKVVVTEPRRIAAVSIAQRISDTIGEPCGGMCGYKIHLENRTGKSTRIELVTEAILSRQLQADPSLEGISAVVIDEFHERSVSTDMNLAFLKEAAELRDDLFAIVMSATIETERLSEYIGGGTPVLKIPGRAFPVQVEYRPPRQKNQIGRPRQNDVSDFMSDAIVDELSASDDGSVILAFLPGIMEIRRTEKNLSSRLAKNVEVLVLHSSISLSEQKRIFSPLNKNSSRVILSSAIAETSLTVPNVTAVIDSGLSRVNRMNVSLGMESLVTESESEFSAEQRKGRAGRIQEGKCIRLWSENEPRQKSMLPEILRADICQLVLECAAWGASGRDSIDFFDKPSAAAWSASAELLQTMDFLDDGGKITARGKTALETGLHPRLANVLLRGASNPDFLEPAVELVLKYSEYADAKNEIQKKFQSDLFRKIKNISEELFVLQKNDFSDSPMPLLLFAGFSDRLAKKCGENSAKNGAAYQFPSGRIATLKSELSFSQSPEWIVAPEVLANESGGTIFAHESVSDSLARKLVEGHLKTFTECRFYDNRKIRKTEKVCYGKIVISEKNLPVEKEDYAAAWCDEIHRNGLKSLGLSRRTEDFLVRAQFYFDHSENQRENSNGDSAAPIAARLESSPGEWLLPFLSGADLTDETVYNAIFYHLHGDEIERKVPSQITLQNGRKAKLVYEMQSDLTDKTRLSLRPVLEIIIQRIFGCVETPRVMGVPVLLKLLSPASRPLQITDDLAGFWNSSWPEICKEMKGRYPKHNWNHTADGNIT